MYLFLQHAWVNSDSAFFFYSDYKWLNILNQYDGTFALKNYLTVVPLKDKKSATIPKHIKDFLKNKN